MATPQPPQDPGTTRDVAPPGYVEPGHAQQTGYYSPPPPPHESHAGPWILGAAIVLVIGALLAVVIHNAGTSDTQTVITRSPTVNTTQVTRDATVTQSTATVTQPPKTQTVTQPPRTTTVTQPPRTVTTPTTTTAP